MKSYIIIVLIFLSSCVVVPKGINNSKDIECDLQSKELTLDVIGPDSGLDLGSSSLAGAIYVTSAGVFVISAVVSSSVVMVGNTIYWLERYGKCDENYIQDQIENHNTPLLEKNGQQIELEN